ncbi:O-glucosyltransferase rumi homolog [Eucalyptus grandis]|uniref:O-glucosyltransferase rumi homolog n=1 Tax=Eucalyptus grandis TaxID=71139 RepID=UPI00192F02C5|nr:O-glucosyltransferase rumi homolog [Eucalyptus grandis]
MGEGKDGRGANLKDCSRVASTTKTWRISCTVLLFLLVFLLSAVFISWMDNSTSGLLILKTTITGSREDSSRNFTYPLNCSATASMPQTCPGNYPTKHQTENSYAEACPEYFRWIHEDLRPWKGAGITREILESSKEHAHFRLVILNGKAYVEKYRNSFQTRDVFTIWGILQLLRLYPGKVPDLELMFNCADYPVIPKRDYEGSKAATVPPLFHYCGLNTTMDIIFPDWSFWGWPEVNIRPWEGTLGAIEEKAGKTRWKDKVPFAYWKGNPVVAQTRLDLMKCNGTTEIDWKARLYTQDWRQATAEGFKDSNLEDQCTHRYKIYVEGSAWSVSEKYILACDAVTLMITPEYYDHFTRGMVPMEHYWPIRPDQKCRDIKFAVEWGNNHTEEAQRIGESGSRFISESLKMKYVYDFMFHLLNEYAKLLKFDVEVPPGAVELCSELMACPAGGLIRKFMTESVVESPSNTLPCSLPPPYEALELKAFMERKESVTRQVEKWESEFWQNLEKKPQT